jgi:carbonic anhydrase
VCRTTIVRNAWAAGQTLAVHGLVYDLTDGLLRRVGQAVDGTRPWDECYEAAIASVA